MLGALGTHGLLEALVDLEAVPGSASVWHSSSGEGTEWELGGRGRLEGIGLS